MLENLRVRLFDLVKQQHTMGVLINSISQEPALIIATISRRRADEARHCVALHIFRHVKPDEFNTEREA